MYSSISLKVKHKIESILPEKYLRVIRDVNSSYILGGAISSIISDSPINDIDIFFHEDDRIKVEEILDFKFENCYVSDGSRRYAPKTIHLTKHFDDVYIDFVQYTDDFSPAKDVDFYCRMVSFDGKEIKCPSFMCIDDILRKKLTFNFDHPAGRELNYCLKNNTDPPNPSLTYVTLVKNIIKLYSKGYS